MNGSQDCPTWIDIDLGLVYSNTQKIKIDTGTALMAVIKADAYGFGATEIAKTVLKAGAEALVVARFGEAKQIRLSGIEAPLMIFGTPTPGEVDQAIANHVHLTLSGYETAELFSARARAMGKTVHVHLKVDTGMGRFGVLADEVYGLTKYALESEMIQIDGIYTHFAQVDSDPDDPLTPLQLERFHQALAAMRSAGCEPKWIHCANSAAALGYPESRFNMIRVGSALLGIRPFYYLPFPEDLHRTITWKTRLASCRLLPDGWGISYGQEYHTHGKEFIGVLSLGYGDGFRRTNNNEVLIDGQRVPVIGKVCVDLCMVRLPRPYPIGTEVVILGEQGGESIYIEDLADRWGTSQADVTTCIHARVPRFYQNRP